MTFTDQKPTNKLDRLVHRLRGPGQEHIIQYELSSVLPIHFLPCSDLVDRHDGFARLESRNKLLHRRVVEEHCEGDHNSIRRRRVGLIR